MVLHLYKKPNVKENEIEYPVKVLLGELPKIGGASTMFIDVVGVSVSPGSVAGVKRRTRRRTAAVVNSTKPPEPAPKAPESVEDRLRSLDSLAANGYITKQEYDIRKQAILDSL